MPTIKASHGFSLMEILIAVFLSTLLISGIVQLISGSVSAFRLQLSLGQLEESSRYAREILVSHISQAGYQPEPWNTPSVFPALTDDSKDSVSASGDQLGLQRWSRRNCYGNENPVKDGNNRPAFFILQTRFQVNTAHNLAMRCRFGPDASQLVTQINNFGLIEDIESMQILYAEDRDADTLADSWVTGQEWQNENNIHAVKVAFLLSTRQAFAQQNSRQITLLDETINTTADGKIRQVTSLTAAIGGRIK